MTRTSYRQRTRPDSPPLLKEEPPAYSPAAPFDPDDDELEELLRYLRTIESEPTSTLARQLIADGIELPPPQSLPEDSVYDKLWEVIHGLAHRRHFLDSTDHLSDFELYGFLWEETLSQPTHELDDHLGDCACQVDLVSDGSCESIWYWLRYYADDHDRKDWAEQFPDDPMPEPSAPPYDRDRHLPKRLAPG